jgi:hypothetical protein
MAIEEIHKTITIPVSYADGKPKFLTARDRQFKEWIFITGGCRKSEVLNPLRCALRELYEETRGIVNIRKGSYVCYTFSKEMFSNTVTTYHVYIIDFNVSVAEQLNIVKKFNELRREMEIIKMKNLPFRRTWDENDALSFDTLDEFTKRPNKWKLITDNVLQNQNFYTALNSPEYKNFNLN